MKRFFIISPLILLAIACIHRPQVKEPAPSPDIRVLLNEIDQPDSLEFYGTYSLLSEEAKYDFGRKNSKIYFKPLKSGFKIFNPNRIFVFTLDDQIRFSPQDDDAFFVYKGKKYKGKLSYYVSQKGKMAVLNILPLEEYLKCVVPAEMPSKEEENLEAIKAQAICARTYALKRMQMRKNSRFDVYADVRDQVYKGFGWRTKYADLAVSHTRGDVLMRGKNLANAYYHSTCAGVLEDTIGVFKESGASKMRKEVRKDIIGSRFACSISPLFRWERRFTLRQLDSLFARHGGNSLFNKEVTDTVDVSMKIIIKKRKPSGRVEQLGIQYGDSLLWLEGYDIRKFFSDRKNGNMRSNLFLARVENDTTLIFEGGGYGHGAGMCQWGALYMSKQGFKYYDILVNKYYPGTYLKKVY